MSLSEDLKWRGLIKDKTFDDISWLDQPKTFYWGIDAASSDSMQVGNLAAALVARRLIEAGWKGVLLAGGATSLIGDPKDTEERKLKPREEIEKNVQAIKRQINKLFAGQEFTPVDNYDWFKDIKYLDFLREVGKSFAMSELIQREFVADRLQTGISYAEFSYSLIQGYDYLQLYKKYKVMLQIGGSDQWGNMLSGVALVRKKEAQEVQALSMPLVIDKATGRKFGKSEAGAIWLDANRTSPYQFYQFWLNTSDEDVVDYLKVFTLLDRAEIDSLGKAAKANPAERVAQQKLAYEVTALVHGAEQAKHQAHIAEVLFGGDVSELDDKEIDIVRKELPAVMVQPGTPVAEALVKSGLAASNSEARRLLDSRGVYIGAEQVQSAHLEAAHFKKGRLLLRRGKAFKDSALVELK